jgi:hypothetical protein
MIVFKTSMIVWKYPFYQWWTYTNVVEYQQQWWEDQSF